MYPRKIWSSPFELTLDAYIYQRFRFDLQIEYSCCFVLCRVIFSVYWIGIRLKVNRCIKDVQNRFFSCSYKLKCNFRTFLKHWFCSLNDNMLLIWWGEFFETLTGTKKHEHISPILSSLHWLPIPGKK